MALGALIFKFLPMRIYGNDILFDSSAHIITASFCLYVLWFFIDQNKNWRLPYFMFSALILFVISVQRIIANAHNDIGLLMGLLVSLLAIYIAEQKAMKGKFRF
jgi:hypothetical protein